MRIIGKGLIASAMLPYEARHPDAVIFASGVSDSSCVDPEPYERERRMLVEAIADARRDRRRLVYFSSAGAVYGTWAGAANEGQSPAPRTPYGIHKLACERLVSETAARGLIVRLPNVVGDVGNDHQLVPSLVAQVLGGSVVVQGRATRDLVDASDVGLVVDALLSVPREQLLVNVASGRPAAALVIVGEIASILGGSPRMEVVDAGREEWFDSSTLRTLIGPLPFDRDHYLRDVLGRHVPRLADRLSGKRA